MGEKKQADLPVVDTVAGIESLVVEYVSLTDDRYTKGDVMLVYTTNSSAVKPSGWRWRCPKNTLTDAPTEDVRRCTHVCILADVKTGKNPFL